MSTRIVRLFHLTLIASQIAGGLLTVPGPARAQAAQAHLWLARPIPGVRIDFGYPYGWNRKNQGPIHHGVDFPARRGTPALAAADGVVVFAGKDSETIIGLKPDFYGNAVILRHDLEAPGGGQLFTLYGHLNTIGVQAGQRVAKGQPIGTVGMTGIAIGPHLHFEVRAGDGLNYNAVRNPEVWYAPLPGHGVVVGRVLDANGNRAPGVRYVLSTASSVFPGWSYADPPLPSDPVYGENFAMNDVRAGCYRLRVRGGSGYAYDQPVCVKAGEAVIVEVKLTQ
jgi:murein DD-endopeptidase MepM/ murein hydrolase activator NlpD